ncbi:SDR family oxidoreductase [Streptomyces sp. NBC_01571]|uniref:SDR family oxidoreductase n=1 Tax=Streptomyces sp. NBC_01571 TaxID=2975883 RepID=UPI00225A8E9C|nr:SDR family oxidoreductase [Streptomyces sp. NBC_01571]MCX4580999.1 SDR family oxidoreductase [Streptomyces sp. NBC_01571]
MGHCNPTGNVVAPGLTETDMVRQLPDDKRAVIEEIPLARIAAPDETAAVVAFLVSPDASYITGAVLPVASGAGVGH